MDAFYDHPLLTRYLNDECSPSEQAEMEEWLAADLRRMKFVAALRALRDAMAARETRPDVEAAKQLVHDRLGITPSRRRQTEGQRSALALPRSMSQPAMRERHRRVGDSSRLRRWPRLMPFTAGVLAACVAMWVVTVARSSGPGNGTARVYATAPGERETVTLDDGSVFTLAPASRLTLSPTYGHGQRKVTLDGEAAFRITHDAARPFSVRARNARLEDLGTRFVVRAYREDPDVQVAVADGRVSLGDTANSDSQRWELARGTVALLGRDGATKVTEHADVDAEFAWVSGELVFRRVPLREAIPRLSRWYAVNIRLADAALGNRLVTGSFRDETVDDALAALAGTINARIEHKGNEVLLVPRGS
jgi:transmembrane sensor